MLLLNTNSLWDVQSLLYNLTNWGVEVGKNILAAVLIYVVGRFIIKQISRLLAKLLEKRKLEVSVQTFLKSLVNLLLNLVLAFAIFGKLGVETTSFAALLASAGVAVGMALSGNLSNFAGGLIILVFKPFKVGDFIDAPGASGTVKEIQIFHTILLTSDNRTVFIPNGQMSSNTVTNYSRQKTRRVEWNIGVEYDENFNRVKEVLLRLINADARILKSPEPFVALGELAESSVNIKVRVWVKAADYWDVFFDMNRCIYETFNREGIGFPFPQLTVHQANKN